MSGRRSKWAVLAVWVLVGICAMPFVTKLQDATVDDEISFVPHDSPSAQLIEDRKQLGSAESLDATVVYYRNTGQLSADDLRRIDADHRMLNERYPQITERMPFLVSGDRKGALINLSVPGVDNDESRAEEVTALRSSLPAPPPGIEMKVTGPGAFVADFEAVYEDIDMTLLLATAGIVALVLLLTYRSPVLWLAPMLAVAFGNAVASALMYLLATERVVLLDGTTAGLLPVLVFGVGTDYALLLIARYREELHRNEDHHRAMGAALRRVAPVVVASGGIIVAALSCLLLSTVGSNRTLAVVGVTGIAVTVIAVLTLLPALLLVVGRRVFWPFIPEHGTQLPESPRWRSVGARIAHRPGRVIATSGALLLLLVAASSLIDTNLDPVDGFRNEPDSVRGETLVEQAFPTRTGEPLLMVANTAQEDSVRLAMAGDGRVKQAVAVERQRVPTIPGCAVDPDDPARCVNPQGKTMFAVELVAPEGSAQERRDIPGVRATAASVPGGDAVIGSGAAERMDVADASARDRSIVIPLVPVVAMLIFCLLLRAVLAPLVLVVSVMVSWGAAVGFSVLVSNLLGYPAEDQTLLLLSYVFLVALGIDYNVFLATRIREGMRAGQDTTEATINALTSTGGVITSAGAVLAATFLVLTVIPLVSVTQLGLAVAFGVLVDTFVVRALLVPALLIRLGERAWWPGRRHGEAGHHSVASPT